MLSSEVRKLRAGLVQIPSCPLVRVEECVAMLRAAGLTGPIDIETFPPGKHYWDGPPGRVVLTTPPRGRIVEPTSQVTVKVNPGEASELTEREVRIQQKLETDYARQVEQREGIFRDQLTPAQNPEEPPQSRTHLSVDLLEELDHRFREAAAVPHMWLPGLTDEAIDELLMPAGIDLPGGGADLVAVAERRQTRSEHGAGPDPRAARCRG